MCEIVITRGQHRLYSCCIPVKYESKEVGKGSLMRVTVAYPKRRMEETVRVLTVWTFYVVQQLRGGQKPDGADCAWRARTSTDLAGENVAE